MLKNSAYIVVQKKTHEVQCTAILQPFAAESYGLHQNAEQKSLSTKIVSTG